MGVIGEVAEVFDFINSVYDAFPTMIKILVMASFGGILYIAFLKSIKR